MIVKKPTGQGGPNRGQGRKKIGEDRGGLTPVLVQVYADQAVRLRRDGDQSEAVRVALDMLYSSRPE